MKVKNRRWYNGGGHYLKAEFDVQVIVGAADLKFRTLGKDGILSRPHATIDVEWYLSPTPSKMAQVAISELGADGLDQNIRSHTRVSSRASDLLMRRFNRKV